MNGISSIVPSKSNETFYLLSKLIYLTIVSKYLILVYVRHLALTSSSMIQGADAIYFILNTNPRVALRIMIEKNKFINIVEV